nr:hypothetical protein [Tanacetum cinerariifolium]
MALPHRDQRHRYLRLEGLEYTNTDIADLRRMLMEHMDAQGKSRECEANPRQKGSECLLGRISSARDFLGTTSSYTSIRDLMLRLCHKLIACSIAERSHVPEKELDNTWAWVAPGPERRLDVAAGALEVAKGALDIAEGTQDVPAPVQRPQPPLAAGPTRSLPHRVVRLEEELHGMRGALGEQREVLDSMARDFT